MKTLDNAYFVQLENNTRLIFKAGTNAENFKAASAKGQPQQFPLGILDCDDAELSQGQVAKMQMTEYKAVHEVANELRDYGYSIKWLLSDGILFEDESVFRFIGWTM